MANCNRKHCFLRLSIDKSIFGANINMTLTRSAGRINTISMYGEKFYRLHAIQRQLLRPLNNPGKNGSFRNIENQQYKKTADLGLFSLFIRTNGKCNNPHAPCTCFSGILISLLKDQNMKRYSAFVYRLHINKISQNDHLKIVNPKTGTLANSEDPDSAPCGISPGSALVGKTTFDQSSKE